VIDASPSTRSLAPCLRVRHRVGVWRVITQKQRKHTVRATLPSRKGGLPWEGITLAPRLDGAEFFASMGRWMTQAGLSERVSH
jgi:hypothetical protein